MILVKLEDRLDIGGLDLFETLPARIDWHAQPFPRTHGAENLAEGQLRNAIFVGNRKLRFLEPLG